MSTAALAARDEAMDRVERHSTAEEKKWLTKVIYFVAQNYRVFTTDAVWDVMDRAGLSVRERRLLGPLMRRAVARRVCVPTGQYRRSDRVECHGRTVPIYKSLIHQEDR
jgi:hypothetical protein